MPARINFAAAFERQTDIAELGVAVLSLFGASVERWEAVDRDDVRPVDHDDLRAELDAELVVIAVSDREPDIRMHLSAANGLDVVTVSFSRNAWVDAPSCAELAARLPPGGRLAAIGEELEIHLDEKGGVVVSGEQISLLSLAKESV